MSDLLRPGTAGFLDLQRNLLDRIKRLERRGYDYVVSTVPSAATVFQHDRFPSSGTLSGTIPSTFTLSQTPISGSLHVYLNGLEQDEGTDYTLSGNVITALTPLGQAAGDVLDARYAYNGTPASTSTTYTPPPPTVAVDFAATGWKYTTVAQSSSAYPTDGVEGSTAFAAPTFDDSAWSTGQAAIGWAYANGSGTGATPRNTTVPALSEVFMRKVLPGGGGSWQVTIKVDNYGYLYFNGNRIDGTLASGAHNGGDTGTSQTKGPFTVPQAWVRSDYNVVALHVQDQAGTSGGGTGYGSGDFLIADVKVTYQP